MLEGAVHGHELLALQQEPRVLDGPLRLGTSRSMALDQLHLRAREDRSVAPHRFLGPAVLFADEEQERHDALAERLPARRRPGLLGLQVELPGDAVTITHPSEPLAEGVLLQLHEDGAALAELSPQRFDLVHRPAAHVEGDGRSEVELGSAIQRGEALALDLEVDDHHGAPGKRP